MSETVTAKKVESFAINWDRSCRAAFETGVISIPCSAVIVGTDGNRYSLRFTAQIISTQAEHNPPTAYVTADHWSIPGVVQPWLKLDRCSFQNAALEYLRGYAPDGKPLLPVEYSDSFFGAVVSDDGTRVTAASGWTVTVGFNPANGWLKLTASLGGVTKGEITGEGLTASDISRLYIVPEHTRRNLVSAAGAKWPDEPPAEEIN